MIRWLLFLHITGVALWLGSLAALFIMHRRALQADDAGIVHMTSQVTTSIMRTIIHPSSIVVLITGIWMIVQLGFMGIHKPFWLSFMERGGGTLVLISLGVLTWQLRRLNKMPDAAAKKQSLARINMSLAGVGAGVLAVTLIVALQL